MKFIKNLIDIDLKQETGEHLILNGNNGLADLIGGVEYRELYDKAKSGLKSSDLDSELFKLLIHRGYLVEDDTDENFLRNQVCDRLKDLRKKELNEYLRVHFIITYDCNFCCPYCYEKGRSGNRVLSKEQVDKVFSIYDNDIKRIGLFGGEPLLPQSKSIIEYIVSKAPEAAYSIITNGYYLDEYIDVLTKINVCFLQVTIDGTAESHNKTRVAKNGESTYDRIINNIKICLENSIPINIRMNITPQNLDDCLKEKQVLEEMFPHGITIELMPIFQCSTDKREDIYKSLFDVDIKSNNKNPILKNLPPISNFIYNGGKLRPVLSSCDADCYYRFYDPYGDIYTCIASVGNKSKRVGTYLPTESYEEKSFLHRDITTIEACSNCKYALFCGGGCANAVNYGDDITNTPNCKTMRDDLSLIPFVYSIKIKKDSMSKG